MTRDELRNRIDETFTGIRRARDEIRLNLHLATLDAKSRWDLLEPRFHEAERLARDVSDVSRRALDEIADRFRDFRSSIEEIRRERRS